MKRRSPWKPPVWLIALDLLALLLVFLGLALRHGVLAGLPQTLSLPLIVVGGALLGLCALAVLRSIQTHRRSG